jgi:uncharacterized membrane protein
MASQVVALVFEGQWTAEGMMDNFISWQEQGIVELEDVVTAARGPSEHVEIKQTQKLTKKYTLRGSGIGLLAGALLGGPIGGLIGGAAIGAVTGSMKDIGIDDKFIDDVGSALGPNSSALFLMGKVLDDEKFTAELKPYKAYAISTTLDAEQEKRLQQLLSREDNK